MQAVRILIKTTSNKIITLSIQLNTKTETMACILNNQINNLIINKKPMLKSMMTKT